MGLLEDLQRGFAGVSGGPPPDEQEDQQDGGGGFDPFSFPSVDHALGNIQPPDVQVPEFRVPESGAGGVLGQHLPSTPEHERQVEELRTTAERQGESGDVLGQSATMTKLLIEETADQPLPQPGADTPASIQERVRAGTVGLANLAAGRPVESDRPIRGLQETVIGAREFGATAPRELAPDPLDPLVRVGQVAGGGIFDVFVTEPARALTQTVSGVDPLGTETTFGGGTPAAEAEATGGTESIPRPVDLIDIPLVLVSGGASKALTTGARAGRIGRTAPDVTRGVANMGVFSAVARSLDELTRAGGAALRGTPTGQVEEAEPALRQAEELTRLDFEDFVRRDVDVGTGGSFTRGTLPDLEETFDETVGLQRAFDEGIDPRPTTTDLGSRFADEAATLRGAVGGADEAVTEAGTRIGDEFTEAFRSIREGPVLRFGDEGAELRFASGDEAAEFARTADEFSRVGDEGAQVDDEVAEEGGGFLRGLIPGGRTGALLGGGAILGGGIAALTLSQLDSDEARQPPAPGEQPGRSRVWSGSLSMPGEIVQGQSARAEARVTNSTGSTARADFGLFIRAPGGKLAGPIDSASRAIDGGKSATLTLTLAGRKTKKLPAKGWEFVLAARGDGTGAIDSARARIVRSDGSTREGTEQTGPGGEGGSGKWGDLQRVRRLDGGWFLFRQDAVNGETTRWFVAGKHKEKGLLFLNASGRVQSRPHPFDSREKALQAHKQWMERVQQSGGDAESGSRGGVAGPSPSAAPPSAGEVRSKAQGGLISSLIDVVPGGLLGVLAIVGLGAYIWFKSDGEPVAYLKKTYDSTIGEVVS